MYNFYDWFFATERQQILKAAQFKQTIDELAKRRRRRRRQRKKPYAFCFYFYFLSSFDCLFDRLFFRQFIRSFIRIICCFEIYVLRFYAHSIRYLLWSFPKRDKCVICANRALWSFDVCDDSKDDMKIINSFDLFSIFDYSMIYTTFCPKTIS